MWLEKEFWPITSQPHPPPFLIIPPLLVIFTATINEQKNIAKGKTDSMVKFCLPK